MDNVTITVTSEEWALLYAALWFAENDGFVTDKLTPVFQSLELKMREVDCAQS